MNVHYWAAVEAADGRSLGFPRVLAEFTLVQLLGGAVWINVRPLHFPPIPRAVAIERVSLYDAATAETPAFTGVISPPALVHNTGVSFEPRRFSVMAR